MAQAWVMDGEINRRSPCTIAQRRLLLDHFLWFLGQKGYAECSLLEIRAFQAYLGKSPEDPEGRWGNPQEKDPLKASTIRKHLSVLSTLFGHLVEEGFIDDSPMDGVRIPNGGDEHIETFTREQMNQILAATRHTPNPRRDEAIVYLLADAGIRASELCALRMSDLDVKSRVFTILGKGNKSRTPAGGTGALAPEYAGHHPDADLLRRRGKGVLPPRGVLRQGRDL
jgi:site-specific recombinase XerD